MKRSSRNLLRSYPPPPFTQVEPIWSTVKANPKGKRNHLTRKPEGWTRGGALSPGLEEGGGPAFISGQLPWGGTWDTRSPRQLEQCCRILPKARPALSPPTKQRRKSGQLEPPLCGRLKSISPIILCLSHNTPNKRALVLPSNYR